MAVVPEVLLEQALRLSPSDRAELASGLLASLDGDLADGATVERLWSEEAKRRVSQIASGDVELTTWEQMTGRVDELRSSQSQ
jgi:hypothetical protein